jgi:HAD superfamily hydrolase (TIGR01509 family)
MPLILPPGPFAAYLFDCDGTIADSMPLHYIAWSTALAEQGCPFPEDLFYAWGGWSVAKIIETLNHTHNLHMPIDLVAHRKEELYYQFLPQLKAVPEVLEQIDLNYGQIPFAVVSGSTRESVEASLNALGLSDKFETLVCAGDYTHGKPNPEPFLIAAQRLGVPPTACLVFEDADPGIVAATAAGMASIKIASPQERALLAQATR